MIATIVNTADILSRIEALGYITTEVIEEGRVCTGAAALDDGSRPYRKLSRFVFVDGTDEQARYRAACELARLYGIDPKA